MSNMTADDVALLTAPFATRDHEFNYSKMIYLTEDAITTRLDEVDPNWSFRVSLVEHRADKVIVYAALTVKGVTRESNGYDEAEYQKGKDRLPEYEVNQREKAALTDALKRCARLFGIGRYILNIPNDGKEAVKDHAALNKWLKDNYGGGAPANATPAPKQPPVPINEHTFDSRKPDTRKKADAEPAPSKSVTLDAAVWVKLGKDGKPFYVFYEPQADHDVFSFTREPFRAAGWDVDAWEYDAPLDKGLGTQINLDRYPTAVMEQAKDGYWHVKHVSAYEFAAPYVEDQAS